MSWQDDSSYSQTWSERLTTLATSNEELSQKLNQTKHSYEELKQQLTEATNSNSTLTASLDEAKKQNTKLTNSNQALLAELSALKQQLTDLEPESPQSPEKPQSASTAPVTAETKTTNKYGFTTSTKKEKLSPKQMLKAGLLKTERERAEQKAKKANDWVWMKEAQEWMLPDGTNLSREDLPY